MHKYINKFLIASLAVAATACTGDYEDINSNPYEPGDLTGDDYALSSQLNNIAGCVMSSDVNTIQFTDALLGGTLGGYFSDANSSFENSFARYNPTNDWSRVFMKSDRIIPTLYANLGQVEMLGEKAGDPVPYAVATVIKIAAMSRVTDTYGPIPYSAIGETTDLAVPYDSQKDVYNEFFTELSEAIETLDTHRGSALSPMGDYVYGGDINKWVKFANSLKLRLAMRVSFVDRKLSRQMAEEAIKGGVIESNADNATWKYFSTLTNPLYTAVMYNSSGSETGGDTHAAADIICYMNGYDDPRREAYFLKSTFDGIDYVGLRRGWETFNKSWGFSFSGVGVKANDPLIWMTASEVAFLRAEGAAIHNFDMGGNAADFYNSGIALSFEQWGVAGAEAYMQNSTARPQAYVDPTEQNPYNGALSDITIKWDDSANSETKLERIITQKWIALYYNGNEAWAELRRTGYPKLIPVEYNGSGGVVDSNEGPQRMPYPQEEYTNNSYNVTSAVNNLLGGPDNMATKMWWAR
ncbi:MAG: SusD/RagB family nutrient-binding outer membrane lipoprotein [Muribaculaceae bacterium]